MTEGPDFICVGLPKAGTGWLFNQLRNHPGFWMPPVKEIGYLKSELPAMKNALRRTEKANERVVKASIRAERDGERSDPKEFAEKAFLRAQKAKRRAEELNRLAAQETADPESARKLAEEADHHAELTMRRAENALLLVENRSHREERLSKGPKAKRKALPDARAQNFLDAASACAGQPLDIDRYAGLFRFKGDQLSGDITPSYASLEEETIALVAKKLPATKVLLILRDPVARAWSHLSMDHRKNRFDASLLESPQEFRHYLEGQRKVIDRSCATSVAQSWARSAPGVTFRHFFFDDLQQQPEFLRNQIFAVLGADPALCGLPANHRPATVSKPKLPLTDPIKAVLVEHLHDELRECATMFGGHAHEWSAQYGL